jgi:hypothetical protein
VLIVDLDTELGDVAGFFGVKDNKYLIQAVPDKAYLDPRYREQSLMRSQMWIYSVERWKCSQITAFNRRNQNTSELSAE